MTAPPTVTAGHITALRLFDIANAIDLVLAESLWSRQARQGARSRLTGTPPKAVSFGEPPLGLVLPPATFTIAGHTLEAHVTARLYEFGVVTLAFRVAAENLPWAEYTARVNEVDAAIGPSADTPLWMSTLDTLRAAVLPALDRPGEATSLEEDYLIATVHSFDAPVAAAALGAEIDLVPLLSGEHLRLADTARADILARRFSYYTDDLVVLTWDRAFIYEPRRDTDVADVLEVANAQLLEMRYYDELLDEELPRMYDLVEVTRRWSLGPRRFAKLARRLYGLVAEVTELTEKVDNALQVTEDVYLARVYTAALDLFRVKLVSGAVDRKLAIIRDTYQALYDESASARAGLMEAAIVVLILVEIVLAIWPRR